MVVLDASSMLHAWDNYPIAHFPPLWNWFGDQLKQHRFSIPGVVFEEVTRKSPGCGGWLRDQDIEVVPLSNSVLRTAIIIKAVLGIEEDDYHAKGVGENDLLIIATTKVIGATLVTEEGRQFRLPDVMAKYKIPAVCGLPEVDVPCIQFIDLIKISDVVFA